MKKKREKKKMNIYIEQSEDVFEQKQTKGYTEING